MLSVSVASVTVEVSEHRSGDEQNAALAASRTAMKASKRAVIVFTRFCRVLRDAEIPRLQLTKPARTSQFDASPPLAYVRFWVADSDKSLSASGPQAVGSGPNNAIASPLLN